ncbi:hypothetical protein M422DRAFT_239415 [Sphaerobolus stellatus SS14]|nr:hypothetical protein M422DRAFT_239415 [Sphaerobolus stellatus SS14]
MTWLPEVSSSTYSEVLKSALRSLSASTVTVTKLVLWLNHRVKTLSTTCFQSVTSSLTGIVALILPEVDTLESDEPKILLGQLLRIFTGLFNLTICDIIFSRPLEFDPRNNPKVPERGHPSLLSVQLGPDIFWSWDQKSGWTCRRERKMVVESPGSQVTSSTEADTNTDWITNGSDEEY